MVPRLVIQNGAPYSSHCPFCGSKIKQFQKFPIIIFIIVFVIFAIVFISLLTAAA